MDSKNNLYITDTKGAAYKVVDGETFSLNELANYSLHKNFFIKSDRLFFNDNNGGFWQFYVNTKEVELVARRGEIAVRLDDVDIKNKRLLYLNKALGKKEIVLFH